MFTNLRVLWTAVFAAFALSVPAVAVAATFTVNSTGDGSDEDTGDDICEVTDGMNDCTLRAAIEQANETAGADTINFNLTLPATITLGSELDAIIEDLTITGPDSNAFDTTDPLVIDLAGNSGAVLYVNSRLDPSVSDPENDPGLEQTVTITGLAVTGAAIQTSTPRRGGGIQSDGNDMLILRNVHVFGNTNNGTSDAQGDGAGGLNINSPALIENVFIENNMATSATDAVGGGMKIAGGDRHLVEVRNVTIENNDSAGGGGGLSIAGGEKHVYLENVRILTNTATGGDSIVDDHNGTFGGGIALSGGAHSVVLKNVTVDGNAVSGPGGGIGSEGSEGRNIIIQNSTITNNTSNQDGGGISVEQGQFDLDGVTISGNEAGATNEAFNFSSSDLPYETKNGTATYSGSLFPNIVADSVTIVVNGTNGETFTDNASGVLTGGGGGTGSVDYDTGAFTVTLNTASGSDGSSITATYDSFPGSGGGISAGRTGNAHNRGHAINLRSTTITNNTASALGGGLMAFDGLVTATGVSISGNDASNGGGAFIFVGGDTDPTTSSYDSELIGRLVADGLTISGNTATGDGPDCFGEIIDVGGLSVGDPTDCIESMSDFPLNTGVNFFTGGGGGGGGCDLGASDRAGVGSLFLGALALLAAFAFSRRERLVASVSRAGLFGLIAALAVGMPAAASAATFDVDSTLDTSDASAGDGTCDDGSGNCTLRAAIEEANATAGADTITFSVTGTITLGSTLDAIIEALTITGPGAASLTVDLDGNDGAVFLVGDEDVTGGNTKAEIQVVTISGLTITGSGGNDGAVSTQCSTVPVGNGGGITLHNPYKLVLSNATITGNTNDGGDNDFIGGGLNLGSSADITDVTIENNTSAVGGGGIFIASMPKSEVNLRNVTVRNNDATGAIGTSSSCNEPGGNGGGILISGAHGSVNLSNVTVDNNTAGGMGGGLAVMGGSKNITIVDSSFDTNTADRDGGGVGLMEGIARMRNVTIDGNEAGAGSPIAVTGQDTGVDTVMGTQMYAGTLEPEVVDEDWINMVASSNPYRRLDPGSVVINAGGDETFTDNGNGTLTGGAGGTGTIDYETSEWTINLNSGASGAANITADFDVIVGDGGGLWVSLTNEDGPHGWTAGQFSNVQIRNNTAAGSGGGLSILRGTLVAGGFTVSGNQAALLGGGVRLFDELILEASFAFDNLNWKSDPRLVIRGASISGNTSTADADTNNCAGGIVVKVSGSIGAGNDCTVENTANLFGFK